MLRHTTLFALASTLAACGGPAAPAASGARPAPSAPAPGPEPSEAGAAQRGATRWSVSDAGGCRLSSGQVWCWSGELAERAPRPSPVALPEPAVELSGSLHFGCALLASGAVACWGDNHYGQLGAAHGAPRSDAPLGVVELAAATAIAVSAEHACASLRDGSVACWGNNAAGQCGHDREYAPSVRQLVRPRRVEGVAGARAIAVGPSSSCALADGGVWCWGEALRAAGGAALAADRTRATEVPELAGARALSLSSACGCAVFAGGRARCFGVVAQGCDGVAPLGGVNGRGSDAAGGVGAGGSRSRGDPGGGDPLGRSLFGWNDVEQIVAGERGACAARAGGRVDCWRHRAASPAPGDPNEPNAGAPRPPSFLLTPRGPAPPRPPGAEGEPSAPGPTARLAPGGVLAIAAGPCLAHGAELECWDERFWEADEGAGPRAIRLP